MMYEPVFDRCVTTTVIQPKKYPSFNQLNNSRNMDQDNNFCGNNNNKEDLPPMKPPRKNQRRLSSRNSFSGDNPIKMKNGTGEYFVDVDHIQVGLKKSNKGSGAEVVDVEVQTTHLVPYRLRFWPKTDCDFKLSPSETSCGLKCICCFKVVSQWILSQVGLMIVVLIWALLGAFAFFKTEGPREQSQSETLAKIQKNLSVVLATELHQTEDHLQQWPSTIHKYLEKHESLFLDAVGAGFGEGGGGTIWTYPGCILFSVSLLTTLGFGAPVPRTPLGRGAAVLFALVGIPLHFLLVLNVGNLTAVKIRQITIRTTSTEVFTTSEQSKWLKWFPCIAILVYYLFGVVMFGVARSRDPIHALMFPLDFTASGGVANVPGVVRVFYALYLEVAVSLAALTLSLVQASTSQGLVDMGLRWGLLTNT